MDTGFVLLRKSLPNNRLRSGVRRADRMRHHRSPGGRGACACVSRNQKHPGHLLDSRGGALISHRIMQTEGRYFLGAR